MSQEGTELQEELPFRSSFLVRFLIRQTKADKWEFTCRLQIFYQKARVEYQDAFNSQSYLREIEYYQRWADFL